jgi:hypothetical protein
MPDKGGLHEVLPLAGGKCAVNTPNAQVSRGCHSGSTKCDVGRLPGRRHARRQHGIFHAMLALLILFTSSGLLLAAVSVPLILRKIGPNPLYGFRVRKTLEDPAVWYPVNAYAAKRLLAVGLGMSISASLLFLVPGMDVVRTRGSTSVASLWPDAATVRAPQR